jgi:hypothetical protein
MSALDGWQSFYVMVGSSAGALIGLQFIVITLLADSPVVSREAGSAFATPTIVHFATVLLLSGIVIAPWSGAGGAAALWGIAGAAGMAYGVLVMRRMRGPMAYRPDAEDWLAHVLLPFAAYATLVAAAYAARTHLREALDAVAACAMLLLFIGIHNAWDTVTYHVFVVRRRHREDGPPRRP